MEELEVYNKFEELLEEANSLEQLEDVGNWLAGVFIAKPPYKATLRKELAMLYKERRVELQRNLL